MEVGGHVGSESGAIVRQLEAESKRWKAISCFTSFLCVIMVVVTIIIANRDGSSASSSSTGTSGNDMIKGFSQADYTAVYRYAANGFATNEDFNLQSAVKEGMGRWDFMKVLKDGTENKPSMLVVNDKFLMNNVLHNLRVPANRVMLEIHEGDTEETYREKLQALKADETSEGSFQPFILKPTHTSEGVGTKVVANMDQFNLDDLVNHVKFCMDQRAKPHESWTLRNLKPGVIAESLYKSEDFGTGKAYFTPYEIKVQTVWGRFYVGVMEGDPRDGTGDMVTDNGNWSIRYWLRRDGTSSCDKQASNVPADTACFPEFDNRARGELPFMIRYSEMLAQYFGAPWLRVDFFIGSDTYGLRVNELAYGSGLPYPLLDDDLAKIMVEGFRDGKFVNKSRDLFLDEMGCRLANHTQLNSVECEKADFDPSGEIIA